MFVERAIESALIFICLALQDRVPDRLATVVPVTKDHHLLVLLLWWALLIAAYMAIVAVLKLLARRLPAWSGREPQAALRGAWLQRIGNERPWGVAAIEYDWRDDCWVYHGVGFDDAMRLRARWRTIGQRLVSNGVDRSTWHLVGEGTLLEEVDGIVKEISRFDIAVLLAFGKDVRRFGVTGKAADLNFRTEVDAPRSREDAVFGLSLSSLARPCSIVDEARHMDREARAALFLPIRPRHATATEVRPDPGAQAQVPTR